MPESKKFEISPSIAIIIAGVLIAGSIVYINKYPGSTQAANVQQASAHVRGPVAGDHIVGSPDAPIVLVEYSDFQCPYCSMIYPTLKRIVAESGGQVAWVMREYPLYQIHPQAMPAALAAECIGSELGDAAFWKYADTVFADQSKLTPEYSASLAKEFGATPATFAQCVSAKQFSSRITTDTAEAEGSGGNGTPFTVILNQKSGTQSPVSGALPYDAIMEVIKSIQ